RQTKVISSKLPSRLGAIFRAHAPMQRQELRSMNGLWVFDWLGSPKVRRVFDVCAAGLLMVLLAPIFGIVSAALYVPGQPLIMRRLSVAGGRSVRLYEFNVAPGLYSSSFDPSNRTASDVLLMLIHNCRGDQLPQLLNVIKGDLQLLPSATAPFFLQ